MAMLSTMGLESNTGVGTRNRAPSLIWALRSWHNVEVGASYDRRMHSIALQRLCLLLSRPADRNAV